MAKPTARAELYTRLSETIGVESAGTLMSYLPGDELATKPDIEALKGEIDGLRASTKSDIEAAKAEIMVVLKAEFKAVVAGLSARIDGLENRMDGFDNRLDVFDGKLDGFHRALLTQTRHFMLAIVGATFSIIAVVAAVGLRPI